MSLVRVRSDIRPLCDKHYRPMKLVEVVTIVGTDVGKRTAFACEENGCQRQYDIDYGYYTIAEGQIERGTTTRIPCPNDEHAMYLSQFEPQGSVRKWLCLQFGCESNKQTRGFVQ